MASCTLNALEVAVMRQDLTPLSRRMPRYKESLVVNLADKLCATAEVSHLYHGIRRIRNRKYRRRIAAAV